MFDDGRHPVRMCTPQRQGVANLETARPGHATRVGGVRGHDVNAIRRTIGRAADDAHAQQGVEFHRRVCERAQITRA